MDGRGIAAALALGAAGVQLGTAFLRCSDSAAHDSYKQVLGTHDEEEDTVLTRAFSGWLARGQRSRFVAGLEQKAGQLLPFPLQNALMRDIRQAAASQDRPEFMALWRGQGPVRGETPPAAELVAETERLLKKLSQVSALRQVAGQIDGEGRSGAGLARHADAPPVCFHYLAGDVQAQA